MFKIAAKLQKLCKIATQNVKSQKKVQNRSKTSKIV